MTIKEVEERTGLPRSNVRFYEKEKLVVPSRNESNGYRDYSENDVENIKKIAYLRTLGISIEDIRSIASEKISLHDAIQKQNEMLKSQITELNRAKTMCEKMLHEEKIGYKELQVEHYVTGMPEYWNDNKPVLKLDSVSFLYIWGSFISWLMIVIFCLTIGLFFYAKLPPQIPIQWNNNVVSSMADKEFIFAYPAACIIIRYLLRPLIYAKLQMRHCWGEFITEYLTNYMCFIALSAEIFSILFVYGMVKNIAALLLVDTVVLLGLLIIGLTKLSITGERKI